MCISYFFRDSGRNCKAVAFSKDGSLFAWCNGEKLVHFMMLVNLYLVNWINFAKLTLFMCRLLKYLLYLLNIK